MYYGERFNAWTHLVGAVLACIGAIWLIVVAGLQGDPWKIVSFSIYGSTLLLLYSISTLYHSTRGRAKVIMRKLDHLSIYLLIAGSYTPFCLVSLRGPWGWSLFGVVWGLAVIGMLQEIKPRSEARVLSIIIYAEGQREQLKDQAHVVDRKRLLQRPHQLAVEQRFVDLGQWRFAQARRQVLLDSRRRRALALGRKAAVAGHALSEPGQQLAGPTGWPWHT